MSYSTIIPVPVGHLIASDNCYSFEESINGMRSCRDFKKEGMLNVIALPLDQKLQYKLDQSWNSKKGLPPVCEGDELIVIDKDGEPGINCRRDMGFLHLIVNLGVENDVRSFAIDDYLLFGEEKIVHIVSELKRLHDLYGYVAYVCMDAQATKIKNFFQSQVN